MRKYVLSFSIVAIFLVYAAYYKLQSSNRMLPVVNPGSNVPFSTPDSSSIPSLSTPSQAQIQTQNSSSKYLDGNYTGDITDAFYGNVQVKVIINGGKITDVQFLDYPHDRRTSQEINSQAMPLLITEAIQVQSASVDIISGATQTSNAFIQSLSSALSKAK